MQAAGIKWARADFTWAQIEPSENEFVFTNYDRVVAEAEKRQVKILPILCYNSKWTQALRTRTSDAWARCRPHRRQPLWRPPEAWEVGTSPISASGPKPDPEQYTALLKVSYETIKAVDPSLEVLYGGMAGVAPKFVEDTLKLGAGAFFDIMNIHPYCYPATIEQRKKLAEVDELRGILRQYNAPERIWITETGWPTHESEVAVHAKFWSELIAAGAKRRFPGQDRWTCAVVVDPPTMPAGACHPRRTFQGVCCQPAFRPKARHWSELRQLPRRTRRSRALIGEHLRKISTTSAQLTSRWRHAGHIGACRYTRDEYDDAPPGGSRSQKRARKLRAGLASAGRWWLNKDCPKSPSPAPPATTWPSLSQRSSKLPAGSMTSSSRTATNLSPYSKPATRTANSSAGRSRSISSTATSRARCLRPVCPWRKAPASLGMSRAAVGPALILPTSKMASKSTSGTNFGIRVPILLQRNTTSA